MSYLQGSYGTVRACTHVPSGKQYAVKILSKRKGNEERSEIIMREVRSSTSWSNFGQSRLGCVAMGSV
jgi:serine/threonine protein kinase